MSSTANNIAAKVTTALGIFCCGFSQHHNSRQSANF